MFFHRRPEADDALEGQLVEALRALKGKIPGILELSCGVNLTPERGNGNQVALRVLFKDVESLRAYGPHPAHQAVIPLVERYADSSSIVDYTDPGI